MIRDPAARERSPFAGGRRCYDSGPCRTDPPRHDASSLSSGLLFVSIIPASARLGAAQEVERLRFAQITDTHVGGEGWRERLERVVAEIVALPPPLEFVALTGDITENSILDDALQGEAAVVLGRLKVPLYVLPGNHDILVDKVDETVTAFRRRFGDLGGSYRTE